MALSLVISLNTAGYWLQPSLTRAFQSSHLFTSAQGTFPVKRPQRRKGLEKLGFTSWHCHLPAINHLTSLICVFICKVGLSPILEGFCKNKGHKAPRLVLCFQGWAKNQNSVCPAPAGAALLGWSPMTLDRPHGSSAAPSPLASPRPALPGLAAEPPFLANHRHCLLPLSRDRQPLPGRRGRQHNLT